METGTSYFGLPIVDGKLVLESDIAQLPFYDFWRDSARSSTMPIIDGKAHVYLHDWEAFCRRFIETGRHRFSATP